jgi:hypothetical protein
MEENNDYYINNIDLDFILKKMNFFFNESEKDKIIKVINSASINNGLETSGLPDQKKILVLRVYLEWKNHILKKKFDINNLKTKETNFKHDNIFNELESNSENVKIRIDGGGKSETNNELNNEENNEENNEDNQNNKNDIVKKNKMSKISDKILQLRKKYNIQENIYSNGIQDNENTITYKNNSENRFQIYQGKKNTITEIEEKNNSLIPDSKKNEKIDFFDEKDELLYTKFKILKMRLEMIDILKYDNQNLSEEIHECKNDYILDKEIIEKYRDDIDSEVIEERQKYDIEFEVKYKIVLENLVTKYINNTENIKNYINETIDFYQEHINKNGDCPIEKMSIYNEYIKETSDIRYKTEYKSIENEKENINSNDNYDDNYHEKNKINKKTMKNVFQKFRQNTKEYDNKEIEYFQKLNEKKKNEINQIEKNIREINLDDIPIRFQVLEKNLSIENKAMIINKLNEHKKNKYLSDSAKYFTWLNGLLKIPFGEYIKLPITCENDKEEIKQYLEKSKEILDSAVYGHEETKENIVQLIAQWISNPYSSGNVIGIQGPMGNGKTTLVKDGIAKAIKRPFEFISLGGSSDSSYLNGHSYTYEGATWGQIVNVLINSNCMNPVFYFDELDKVSNTPKGEEIINLLIHITDATQNTKFQDRYFSGIDIDLSRAVFIFSYNEISKINPILLDRFIQIKTNGFEVKDKVNIFKQFLYKNISENLGIKTDVHFSYEIIKFMIEKYTDEKGVRNLNKIIYAILSKINVSILTQSDEYINENGKIIISEKILKEILKDENNVNYILNSMYI